MPFINIDGQYTEVSQEQYDIYTVGQNVKSGTPTSPQTEPGSPAAGGTSIITPTVTSPIIDPNTTISSPNQLLNVSNQTVSRDTSPGENLQVVTQSNTAPSLRDLTETEKAWIGGADPTDPFVLAQMDAALGNPPAASEVQTLSGAIGNISFGNIGTAISNTASSFGNAVSNFFSTANAAPSASSVDTAPAEVTPGVATGSAAYDEDGNLLPGYQLSENNDPVYVGGNADTPVQTTADTTVPVTAEEGYYQQFVSAFQQEQDAPTPTENPYAPVAAVGDTPLVEAAGTVTVEGAGAEFDNVTPIEAADDAPVDPATDPTAGGAFVEQADGSFVAAEDLPPTDINGEAYSPTEDPNTPQEVSAVTTDALARDPGSYSAEELNAIAAAQGVDDGNVAEGGITDQQLFDNEAATSAANAKDRARDQQTLRQQQALTQTSNDWRVKLSLAKNADYLYNAADPGILKPLSSKSGTSGVVFPYTPQINTNYRADYSPYTLTHSNYKGYFYNSSYMDAVNIQATFTAQDTLEAEYLLAVIHFFRSVTKMFYGQDTQRGSPPPLVFLSGLGEYQFNQHPCVVSQFTYNLPADVDYIRATSIVNQGISFNNLRSNQSSPVSGLAGVSRLANALLPKGAKASPPAPQMLGKNNSTYVPTKLDMTITLLPVQSRNQVSKVFSLSKYASGNQLKGGFW